MLGRVRPWPLPSPLDNLETPPSEIIKDDSLSIYEATLMKLSLGSRRHLISPLMVTEETDCASETVTEAKSDLSSEAMNFVAISGSGTVSKSCQDISSDEEEEAMVIDTDCCSTSVSNSSSHCRSMVNLNSQQQSKGVSIFCLFSKFKGNQRDPTISHEAMIGFF